MGFVFVLMFAGKFLGILLTEASLSAAGLSIFVALAMLGRSCQASFHIQGGLLSLEVSVDAMDIDFGFGAN